MPRRRQMPEMLPVSVEAPPGIVTQPLVPQASVTTQEAMDLCHQDEDKPAAVTPSQDGSSAVSWASDTEEDLPQDQECLPLPQGQSIFPAFKTISSSLSDGSYPHWDNPFPFIPPHKKPSLPYPMVEIAYPVLDIIEPWLKQQASTGSLPFADMLSSPQSKGMLWYAICCLSMGSYGNVHV